jgi:hypothetical protein
VASGVVLVGLPLWTLQALTVGDPDILLLYYSIFIICFLQQD